MAYEEVLHRSEHQHTVKYRSENIGPPVFECSIEARAPRSVVFVGLTGSVFDETPFCYCRFLGRQPLGIGREVWEDEQS